jgi:hypothetical protein
VVSLFRGPAFGGDRRSNRKRCSFCGRRDEVVEHLVRARGATYICDRCVAQAQEAIAAAPAGDKMLRIRPTPGQVADRDNAELAIEEAFETLFNPDLSFTERCTAIAGGHNLAPVMQDLNDRYPSRGVDVSVDYIRFVSEDEAEVHFVLFVSQFPSGLQCTGHAVLVDYNWKVTRNTWCDLARMAGIECPPPED